MIAVSGATVAGAVEVADDPSSWHCHIHAADSSVVWVLSDAVVALSDRSKHSPF